MINKIKSAIGGLAASVLMTTTAPAQSVTNAPAFTAIKLLSSDNYSQVRLDIKLDAGDKKSYTIESCSNLTENAWSPSLSNTNVVNTSPSGRVQNIYVLEPLIADKMNYRLKSN
jgi:hypothetical protein